METIERSDLQDVYSLAQSTRSYDDWPLVPRDVDPQVSLSTNSIAQPFFLSVDHDICLAQLTGVARIEFSQGPITEVTMGPADWLYVPAGIGYRVFPRTPSVQLQYSGNEDHAERASFVCERCHSPYNATTWNTGQTLRQEGYAAAVSRAQPHAGQPCDSCGELLPAVAAEAFRWDEVAAALRRREGGVLATDPASYEADPIHTSPDRYPRKANALWSGHLMSSQSLPMFPELGPGCPVPCVAMVFGRDRPYTGSFHHENSVDEVILWQATSGGSLQPGMLKVGQRSHVVRNALPDPRDPEQFVVSVIVQRQSRQAVQRESITFRCQSCGEPVISKTIEFSPPSTGPVHGFDTIILAARTAAEFNLSDSARTCRQCGTVNPVFELEHWGWDRYMDRLRIANLAALSLRIGA